MTKINMKKVGGVPTYVKYADHKAGDILVDQAQFLGSYEGKFGIQHKFKTDKGEVVLNSSGQLNYLVETYLSLGDVATVVYNGKNKIAKGPMAGKEAHAFELLVADQVAAPTIDSAVKAAVNSSSLLAGLE